MDLKMALQMVVEAGFEVRNEKGGYICRRQGFGWMHQRSFCSTDTFETPGEMADSFLCESGDFECC
jgi:hypothetical protein